MAWDLLLFLKKRGKHPWVLGPPLLCGLPTHPALSGASASTHLAPHSSLRVLAEPGTTVVPGSTVTDSSTKTWSDSPGQLGLSSWSQCQIHRGLGRSLRWGCLPGQGTG